MAPLVACCALWICASPADHAAAADYNLRASPHASFVWSPQFPQIGEPITLTSTSTEAGGRIVRYAWDFHDNGPFGAFVEGAAIAGASFATPAPHVVRLRVTDQAGLTDIAAETIQVKPPPPSANVMYPFPIVRIRGRDHRFRVRLTQVAVKAPPGTLISAVCRRPRSRCPVRWSRRTSASTTGRLRWTRLHRLERFFPAGSILEIRVSGRGEIGSYTRFHVRRRKLPTRRDTCLDVAGSRSIACPLA